MKHLKTILKLAVSAAIIFLVIRKIDERLLWQLLQQAHWGWLLWAALWFVISKVIAAYRFQTLLASDGIALPTAENLRLYWLGMYYNLLLPGGISGDGYKIKILMDTTGHSFKRLFAITLLDRLSGVMALGQLCLLLLPGIPAFRPWWWVSALGLALSLPVSLWVYRWSGGGLRKVWAQSSIQSLAVQFTQTIATLGIIFALGQGPYWLAYSILFLVSSVVAMLPLTIGGAGAREITFLYGAQWMQVDAEKAVAIAFLFYLVSTVIALFGIIYSFNLQIVTQTKQA